MQAFRHSISSIWMNDENGEKKTREMKLMLDVSSSFLLPFFICCYSHRLITFFISSFCLDHLSWGIWNSVCIFQPPHNILSYHQHATVNELCTHFHVLFLFLSYSPYMFPLYVSLLQFFIWGVKWIERKKQEKKTSTLFFHFFIFFYFSLMVFFLFLSIEANSFIQLRMMVQLCTFMIKFSPLCEWERVRARFLWRFTNIFIQQTA